MARKTLYNIVNEHELDSETAFARITYYFESDICSDDTWGHVTTLKQLIEEDIFKYLPIRRAG